MATHRVDQCVVCTKCGVSVHRKYLCNLTVADPINKSAVLKSAISVIFNPRRAENRKTVAVDRARIKFADGRTMLS